MAGETPNISSIARSALEATRSFVHSYWGDADGLDEVKSELAFVAGRNPAQLEESLDALEVVLNEHYPEGTLFRLVAWDGNRVLEDPSDAGAKAFLRQLAATVREVLDSTARP